MSLFPVIIHDLSRTSKTQSIPGDPFQIGMVSFEQMYIISEPDVVVFEFFDIFLSGNILCPHPVVFHRSHLTQNARDEKVE